MVENQLKVWKSMSESNKTIIKLSKLFDVIKTHIGFSVITAPCIGDIFKTVYSLGIRDIIVSDDEMSKICQYYLANVDGDKDGGQGEVIKTGKLDRFYGVNLHGEI